MKNRADKHSTVWFLGAVSVLCATAAIAGQDPQRPEAQQIVYRQELPTTGMGFHSELRFPCFDPRRGSLQGVRISFETEIVGSAQIENLGSAPVPATNAFGAHFKLSNAANRQVLAETRPMQVIRTWLGAYDDVFDFGGPSGATYRPIAVQEDIAISLSAQEISSFIGPAGDAGALQLNVDAQQDNFGIGSPEVMAMYLSNGAATVTVSYVYLERQDGEVIGEN